MVTKFGSSQDTKDISKSLENLKQQQATKEKELFASSMQKLLATKQEVPSEDAEKVKNYLATLEQKELLFGIKNNPHLFIHLPKDKIKEPEICKVIVDKAMSLKDKYHMDDDLKELNTSNFVCDTDKLNKITSEDFQKDRQEYHLISQCFSKMDAVHQKPKSWEAMLKKDMEPAFKEWEEHHSIKAKIETKNHIPLNVNTRQRRGAVMGDTKLPESPKATVDV